MGNVLSQLVIVVSVSASIVLGGATLRGTTPFYNCRWNNCMDCGANGCFWCGTEELACFEADVDCPSPSSIVLPPGNGKLCPQPSSTIAPPPQPQPTNFYFYFFYVFIGGTVVLGLVVAVLLYRARVSRTRPLPFEPLPDIQFDALEEAIELRQIATTRGNRYEDAVEERDDEILFDRNVGTTVNLINFS